MLPTRTYLPAAVLQFNPWQRFMFLMFLFFLFRSELLSQTAVSFIKCQNVALSSNKKNIINVWEL